MLYPDVKKLASMLFVSVVLVSGCSSGQGSGTVNTPASNVSSDSDVSVTPVITAPATEPVSTLDVAETKHLVFMREEEKLARDVYLTLYTIYPDAEVFSTIGEGSEQTHTTVIRDKLDDYGIADPNPATDLLPASIGIYTGEEFGAYFTEKYTQLVEKGSISELDALYVGAFIEELDMHDIVECPYAIMDSGVPACGLNYTDEEPLINTYRSLVDGSKNHLRAFVGRIEAIIGEGNYVAQVISQDEVDAILGR